MAKRKRKISHVQRKPLEQLDFLQRIRRVALAGICSDDVLMEELVLKGGNALDIGYGVSVRSSLDLDFSMGKEFESVDLLRDRVNKAISSAFAAIGIVVFDLKVEERPEILHEDTREFWGGYQVSFKIIAGELHQELRGELDDLRKYAEVTDMGQGRIFTIDISKNEYRGHKKSIDVEGFTVFVYTPEAIVAEKVRALCQQMPEYIEIIYRNPRQGKARARDFIDIYTACEGCPVDMSSRDFRELVRLVFDAKRVPLELIGRIADSRDLHELNYQTVVPTMHAGFEDKGFDFYFDYVVKKCACLEVLWKVDSPS